VSESSNSETGFARGCMTILGALQTMSAWAEDRALLRSTPSADPRAKTRARAERNCSALCSHTAARQLRDWHQRDKPSRHDAATSGTGSHSPLSKVNRAKFHFTVNQDTSTSPISTSGEPSSSFAACSMASADRSCTGKSAPRWKRPTSKRSSSGLVIATLAFIRGSSATMVPSSLPATSKSSSASAG
jgi:hypothetical protein